MENFDFSGWATRHNIRCSDGKTISKDAFAHNDGQKVPLVWNHSHNDPDNVLGYGVLEHRDEGVYVYGYFNDTDKAQNAKSCVQHGDITALSIYANRLKQQQGLVQHGEIREVSFVYAGANPEAYIDNVISHGEVYEDEAVIYTGENIELTHADSDSVKTVGSIFDTFNDEQKEVVYYMLGQVAGDSGEDVTHADGGASDTSKAEGEETVADILNTFTEKQKNVMAYLIAVELENQKNGTKKNGTKKNTKKGDDEMKQNAFEQNIRGQESNSLCHADQQTILARAKVSAVGSLKNAIAEYMSDESIQHAFEDVDSLFPEYQWVKPGAPELLERDKTWVDFVMDKVHKSPYSRIRTRQADIRDAKLRAKGYKTGTEKKKMEETKLLGRTTDPQTVFIKDAMERDDIIDITDFDVVAYQYSIMKTLLREEVALAIMVGDRRDEDDADKIHDSHIRPIWKDSDLYTIYKDVDIDGARESIQGKGTSTSFGDNYVYAEAIVTAALDARIDYKGTGGLDFYCTPQLLNKMLLARDMNGRRIYESKADLTKALNVGAIHTAEQFEGLTRTTDGNKTKKLLGLFVSLSDYRLGATKGGEITKFEDFDIDFNQYKYLIETRVSGAAVRPYSSIALEEDVTVVEDDTDNVA